MDTGSVASTTLVIHAIMANTRAFTTTAESTELAKEIREELARLWEDAAYVIDNDRSDAIRASIRDSFEALDSNETIRALDAYYAARREYVLARRDRQVYYWRSWKGMLAALALLVAGIVGSVTLFLLKAIVSEGDKLYLGAVLGGGMGGCAAVLVQALDVNPESEVVSKFPWYVIKPVLGAGLGLVSYLALASGISVLTNGKEVTSLAAVVVVGFLAGYFESFSKGLLGRIANQYSVREEPKKNNGSHPDASDTQG